MSKVNIAITGASGLIGTQLREQLARSRACCAPDLAFGQRSRVAELLAVRDAVVHLAGEPIGAALDGSRQEAHLR